MEGYYVPKYPSIGGAATPSGISITPNSLQSPIVELPEVGAKILLVINPYGGVNVVDGENLQGGMDVVEVEVTSIKKSKTTLE